MPLWMYLMMRQSFLLEVIKGVKYMRSVNISWIEHDVSVLNLEPMERLQLYTNWSASQPMDEPWLAIIEPTSRSKKYFIMSLSLNAYHKFTKTVLEEFHRECEHLLALCTLSEFEEMQAEESVKGNPGKTSQIDELGVRVIVPSRLLAQAKAAITDALNRVSDEPVEEASFD